VTERFQAIRGMNDVLPEETTVWRYLERVLIDWVDQYGYQEIRFPFLERTSLFKRTLGEVTDIVQKEMYTFTDLNGESISLRPEGTVGCLRACLEHGLLRSPQKLWYMGPMFRHEKPQKGRYRQFSQLGVEAFGFVDSAIELEMLAMCQQLWVKLGVASAIQLQINTLGELSERRSYREALRDYFKQHEALLDEDSMRRLETNPLRILDSKNPDLVDLIARAPQLLDWVSAEGRQSLDELCAGLSALGISYTLNPKLVRGLDYYGGLAFEWVTDQLGSQATVCGGGRYDTLVEQFGGPATPAIGFAIGIDRLELLMQAMHALVPKVAKPFIYVMVDEASARPYAFSLADQLRSANTEWQVVVDLLGGPFKRQFKRADKSGAQYALVLGATERQDKTVTLKPLRNEGEQCTYSVPALLDFLQQQ
jgi:histidyl-tRNA synthetase